MNNASEYDSLKEVEAQRRLALKKLEKEKEKNRISEIITEIALDGFIAYLGLDNILEHIGFKKVSEFFENEIENMKG